MRYYHSAATPHYAIILLITTEKVNFSDKVKTWVVLRIAAQPKLGTKHKGCVRINTILFTETKLFIDFIEK